MRRRMVLWSKAPAVAVAPCGRAVRSSGTPSRGELVPDEFTITLWQKKMESATVKGSFQPDHDILLLDGIPRNRHQIEMMEDYIEVLALLHLTCRDKQQMIERIQRRALIESRLDDANL